MIVKKVLDCKVEDGIETTRREIKEVPEEEEKKIREFVEEIIDNDGDPESFYRKGIGTDFEGDLHWINFNWLIDYVEDRQTDLKNEGEEEETEYGNNKEILPILTKYKDHTF